VQRGCEELAQASVSALGIADAVIHLEAFRRSDGSLWFGECGVRVGGCFTAEMVQEQYGVDLSLLFLQLLVGEPIRLEPRREPGVRCRVHLPTREGVLKDLPTVAELLTLPNVCAAEVWRPIGRRLAAPTLNAVTALGFVVVAAVDADEAAEVSAQVVRWFLDRVVTTH